MFACSDTVTGHKYVCFDHKTVTDLAFKINTVAHPCKYSAKKCRRITSLVLQRVSWHFWPINRRSLADGPKLHPARSSCKRRILPRESVSNHALTTSHLGWQCSRERLRSQAGLDTQPTSVRADRCKINFVRRVRVRARQIKLMEQISPVIKIKIGVSYNLA